MRVFAHPPAVVGHRGAGQVDVSGFDENSVESCLAAHGQGAGWVELDARLTLDGELVLHHDAVLPDGRPVDAVTFDDCRTAGLAGFDELLDALPDGLGVDLEVKVALGDATSPASDSTAGRVAARAAELRARRPVVVTSFSAAALLQSREVAPDVPTGLLGMPFTSLRELVPAAVALDAAVIAPHVATMGLLDIPGLLRETPERIRGALDVAARHGCETLVWGVRPPQVAGLVELGVEAVCVDEIPATVEALGAVRDGS
jgi:glycerophosphoryl diester phosphodiesterase